MKISSFFFPVCYSFLLNCNLHTLFFIVLSAFFFFSSIWLLELALYVPPLVKEVHLSDTQVSTQRSLLPLVAPREIRRKEEGKEKKKEHPGHLDNLLCLCMWC